MRRSTVLTLALAWLAAATGCDFPTPNAQSWYQGNGTVKEVARPAGAFTGIDVGGAIEAEVSIGPVPKVTLVADENLLPLIGTEVRGGILYARPTTNVVIKSTGPIRLVVVAPALDRAAVLDAGRVDADLKGAETKAFRVAAAGSGSVTVRGIDAGSIEVDAGGSSRVTISGRAGKLGARLDDASSLKAGSAPAESAVVHQGGSSGAEVRASASILARISDASRLVILGGPKASDVKASGAASVERR